MLFNSVSYLIFLPIVFFIYWGLNRWLKFQNLFLLIASYFFYGYWDYRFLGLIVLSTIVDFFIGQKIYKCTSNQKAKYLLWVSILFNIGLLGFFKYYNFFIDSFVSLLSNVFGYNTIDIWTLNIILPVGISFYTFQTMSYSIDIYREKMKPTKDLLGFAAFVAFFPQLVAGPIERATNLLPQILNQRNFNPKIAIDGMRLILWGLFKKVVIADSLAPMVNDIFENYTDYNGSVLFLGAVFFAIQIYGDFSGYSDIAIGTAKLFGIQLMTNFNFPYFSRNIGEFWRRWHISLSTWFRDYIYIPMGGSRGSRITVVRNIFIVFLVSGLWHGANWTFVIWGLFHAILFLPLYLTNKNRKYVGKDLDSFQLNLIPVVVTFLLVTLGWIFFRSASISNAFFYLERIFFNFNVFELHDYSHPMNRRYFDYIIAICIMFFLEYSYLKRNKLYHWFNSKLLLRYSIYTVLIFMILVASGEHKDVSFIYFSFNIEKVYFTYYIFFNLLKSRIRNNYKGFSFL